MFSHDMKKAIETAAREAGIEPALLKAVAKLESGGRAFALVDGRKEPLIRFEGHYFDRQLEEEKREEARTKGLASPQAGAVKNPASQTARWRMLEEAMAIDREAALQSVSWGIGQVMGAHWKALGYASVEDLVTDARSGAEGQVRLMLGFISANGLTETLKAHDWAAFARAYNGPRYRAYRYDRRLAEAYHAFSVSWGPDDADPRRPMALGDGSEEIRDLQLVLTVAGYPLTQDGWFGPATQRAVKNFQAARGLAVDGIAGMATLKALQAALRRRSAKHRFVSLLPCMTRMLPVATRILSWRTGLRS